MGTAHTMPFGATLIAGGGVAFRLWAPAAEQIVLEHAAHEKFTPHPMEREQDGWHRLELAQAGAGDSYRMRLPDGLVVADPASRFNPNDVHGASQVIDPQAYDWRDTQWRGRPWHEAVVYELHIGTFTPEGTFAAARQRLPYLAETGITAIELMPLADFPGKHGWGYDGVLLFAPEAAYGTPDELKALVDAAHALGLMVLLDVVYNHFGPEGNYLHAYCPQFFNPAHQTPWGAAINFDGAQAQTVRDFFTHNALYWICEFHFDGLRMDAIHAIRDDSPRHIVRDICAALRNGPGRERQVHVVLENDLNQASLLARGPTGAPECADAQWNDDIHHAGHVLLTGESDGYYCDYADAPLTRFAQALAGGFIYQGQASPFRDGALRGEPCTGLPLAAFVSFLQNHDQIGNRAMGERLVTLAQPALVRAGQACILLSPHVPMLFMGEEFACSAPFLYFCDFGPELARQVAEGRRAEFGRFAAFASKAAQAAIPDPNDESSFLQSKLRWHELESPLHQSWRDDVRRWLTVRREHLFALLQGGSSAGEFTCDGDTLRVVWKLGGRDGTATAHLHLLAHFGAQAVLHASPMHGRTLVADAAVSESGGWRLSQGAVVLTLQEASHD